MPRNSTTTKKGSRPQVPAGTRSKRGHGAKPEATRERAVLALLSEKTITAAAAKAGIDESTLRRWLAEDEGFQSAYASARQATFDAGMSRVQALTAKAVETLEDLLDETAYPNVRLGAARTVAELGIHQHDAETIMRKLAEIEAFQREPRLGRR